MLKTVNVENIGRLGILLDPAPHTLAPEAWTDGLNVRFQDNKAVRVRGPVEVLGTPGVPPYWALGVPSGAGYFIIYGGEAKVYAVVAATEVHTNITRQTAAVDVDYNMDEELLWNGGLLGGIPILNNGVDVPQYWPAINVGTKLEDLADWPSTHRCRVMRPFGPHLIAMYLTESSVVFPHRVLISHPADPGSVPASWNVADPTKDAITFDLTDDTEGVILDGMALGKSFIVYKENSAHRLTFIGGVNLWQRDLIPGGPALLHTSCVRPVPTQGKNPFGGMHFCATVDDLVLFDGSQQMSLLSEKARRYLRDSISQDMFNRSFVVANRRAHEMWFCYPEAGATWPTRVAVWNYDDNVISFRPMEDLSFAAPLVVEEPTGTSDLWDDDPEVWNDDTTVWGSVTPFSVRDVAVLGCDPVNTKFWLLDEVENFQCNSFLERTGLAIIGRDRQGNPKVDFSIRKMIPRVWIKASGEGAFTVRLGFQETLDTSITWWPAQTFTPGVDQYVDFTDENGNVPNGRIAAIRFDCSGELGWEIYGYDLEMTLLGKF